MIETIDVKRTRSRSTEYTASDWPDGMKVLLGELLLALHVSGGKGSTNKEASNLQ